MQENLVAVLGFLVLSACTVAPDTDSTAQTLRGEHSQQSGATGGAPAGDAPNECLTVTVGTSGALEEAVQHVVDGCVAGGLSTISAEFGETSATITCCPNGSAGSGGSSASGASGSTGGGPADMSGSTGGGPADMSGSTGGGPTDMSGSTGGGPAKASGRAGGK